MEGFEDFIGVERKGSIDELASNYFTRDRGRMGRAMSRLSGIQFPYLLLDFSLAKSYNRNKHRPVDPACVMDRVFRDAAERGIRVLWIADANKGATGRALLGERVLRILWSHIMYSERRSNGTIPA